METGMIACIELRRFALFKNLKDTDLEAFAAAMRRRTFARDVVLFEKGDPGEAMMLICSGKIRIFMRDDQGNQITFRTLEAGQIVGEFSLIDRKPRSASAAALTPVEVLVLRHNDFSRLLRDRPLVGLELMRNLAERIRYTTLYLERLYDAVELLSNNEYDEALREMMLTADEDEAQPLITAFLAMVHSLQQRQTKRKPSLDGLQGGLPK
jgi:CRP-like cAMP-binding protein